MNYTLKDASKIRVGDTLTLEDGTKHEAVNTNVANCCFFCSIRKREICKQLIDYCYYSFVNFKQIK